MRGVLQSDPLVASHKGSIVIVAYLNAVYIGLLDIIYGYPIGVLLAIIVLAALKVLLGWIPHKKRVDEFNRERDKARRKYQKTDVSKARSRQRSRGKRKGKGR